MTCNAFDPTRFLIILLIFCFRCPAKCSCIGFSVDCTNVAKNITDMAIYISPSTRMLDLSNVHHALSHVSLKKQNVQNLAHLNLSACEIRNLSATFLSSMQNLLFLDLSHNQLKLLASHTFLSQSRLKSLILNGNLNLLTIDSEAFTGLVSIKSITLKNLQINKLSKSSFSSLSLDTLDVSESIIHNVEGNAFERLNVKEIYLATTNIKSFSSEMFSGLESLTLLVTNDFSLCCIKPSYLPDDKCFPQKNEFSSCSDLMRNPILRSCIWIFGLFALIGNVFSFFYQLIYHVEKMKLGYGMFTSNLAISDFLMGLYLIIIAGADMYFRGEYSLYDDVWRNSLLCNFAGILAPLSSEASILFIALITVDRMIVVKYPFGEYRIKEKRAYILTIIAWSIAIILSIVPVIFTSYFGEQFYTKSGVCLALPFAKQRFPGWEFTISVFLGFNTLATLLIIFGQWFIYKEIIKSSGAGLSKAISNRKNEMKIARNLILVAATDLLCWCPIVILGKSYAHAVLFL